MLLIVDCAVLNLILKWCWIWVQHNLKVAVLLLHGELYTCAYSICIISWICCRRKLL